MTLLVCWLVFPLVLGLLSLGCGLLLERLSGLTLPGPLLPAAGLALIVVGAQFATLADPTAELAMPGVVAASVAGFALAHRRERKAIDPSAAACALGVFAVFSAPVVLSGDATFAGYIKLDDTATWLAMTDRVMEHGRSVAGLAPSTYEATLDNYLATGYPVGSFLPLGVGRPLVGQDLAWLFQPYLAFLGAMLALGFYVLSARLVEPPALRALTAAIASQPALLFAYSLWGGVKELAAAWILALVAATTLVALRAESGPRSLLPLALASAAALGVLSVGGATWLVPALAAGATALYLRSRGLALRKGAAFLVLASLLSLPSLLSANVFLKGGGTLRSETELGNLIEPLSPLQFFGVWPAGDFRTDPAALGLTYVLIAFVVVTAVFGLAWAASRRAAGPLLYIWTATLGCSIVAAVGSPWVDGKALATASPAFVLAGLIGAASLFRHGRGVEGALVTAAIAAGVLWSNALAYHEVNLAPRGRLAELEQIGERIAGQGPTLMNDYEPYGARHFLREADAEGASELRRREVPLRGGGVLEKLEFADVDQLQLEGLLVYRTLVLRRSPVASRPPSIYRLAFKRRYYEVWQRPAAAEARIVERLPLGDRFEATARASCPQVRRLARAAGEGGSLAAIQRPPANVLELSRARQPPAWQADPDDPAVLYPRGAGALAAKLSVSRTARYGIWLGGSFRRRVELLVDGNELTSARHELSHSGHFVSFGDVRLRRGKHRLTLRYGEADLHPGSGGPAFAFGPLVLARETINRPVELVRAAQARSLCGRRLDWVEALRQ
jgi:hypothetical protein